MGSIEECFVIEMISKFRGTTFVINDRVDVVLHKSCPNPLHELLAILGGRFLLLLRRHLLRLQFLEDFLPDIDTPDLREIRREIIQTQSALGGPILVAVVTVLLQKISDLLIKRGMDDRQRQGKEPKRFEHEESLHL